MGWDGMMVVMMMMTVAVVGLRPIKILVDLTRSGTGVFYLVIRCAMWWVEQK